jgi:amino acid transporter
MVAGGPYGLENVVQSAGYFWAVVALAVIPFIWSLPTTLMVSELASAIPAEGGFYVWVRRGLGPFWGFQEAWLSLAASIFDMAIYPILFVTYLGFVGEYAAPSHNDLWSILQSASKGEKGPEAVVIGIAMIGICVLANLLPARSVGSSSVLLTIIMLAPFAVLAVLSVSTPPLPAGSNSSVVEVSYVTALLFAMWNYMGWDNATTIAGEVDRPQRAYPLVMGGAVALVMLTYLIPVLAAAHTAKDPRDWDTGTWVRLAADVGTPALAIAVGIGGMISALGMFNSLVLSYSRLPVVLAEDRYLPAIFARRLRTGSPWVAILACGVGWALASQLGLTRVLALDVILYGLSLLLEFAALVALRLREPDLVRPFRVPGGLMGAILLGVFPAILIGLAIWDQSGKWKVEEGDPFSPAVALLLGGGLAVLGPMVYFVGKLFRKDEAKPALEPGTASEV